LLILANIARTSCYQGKIISRPSRENATDMQASTQMIDSAITCASSEIAKFLIESYRNERGVHAETILAAAAALAGEFALRAVEPVLPETGWVISDKINPLLFEDERRGKATLWTVVRTGAERAGAAPEDLPDPVAVVARVAAAVGGSPFPPLSIPDRHYPHEWSPNACPRLRGGIEKIAAEQGLSAGDTAMALAYAIALLIAQTKDVLPPAIAATLALEVMVGVSRMVPMKQPL
jgi:hypothetical protein